MNKYLNRIAFFAIALAVSVFAQEKPGVKVSDSLSIPKNVENYNNFQIEKWGPVTYSGDGKCDILNLYHKSVALGLGYSTIVDYHYKEVKFGNKFSCESWGLGIAFKVAPDTSRYSADYQLPPNRATAFSARTQDAVKKLFDSDSAFLEVESIMPVSFQTVGKCRVVDFLFSKANEQSGYHGIVDIKFDESLIQGQLVCTFWGLAVKYRFRSVIEKEVVKKRVIEVIKVPQPKPDTVYVPKPAEKPTGCCITINCYCK